MAGLTYYNAKKVRMSLRLEEGLLLTAGTTLAGELTLDGLIRTVGLVVSHFAASIALSTIWLLVRAVASEMGFISTASLCQ